MPEYKGPLAFFRRHSNGDYSLGRSYWVNTFLVSLFAPAVGLMLGPWLERNFPARYGSVAVLVLTVVGVVAWFWAVAGTWASANKHVSRGGKAGWAMAAKVMITLAILRTVAEVVHIAPGLREHFEIATGAQPGPGTRLEVVDGGRSIVLSGGINDGSAEQLSKALEIVPSVTTVVLDSDGGWLREGQMLAAVIARRGLNTYVEGRCASACTLAFLAGRERAAAPSAQIGFHASRRVGSTETVPSPGDTAQLAGLYRLAGLPDSFVREALNTPSDRIWYPSHEVMLAAGVLTRVSLDATNTLATSVHARDELVAVLRKIELYGVLAERFPVEFERLADGAWTRLQQGAPDAEVTTVTRAQLGGLLPRQLPLARDESLVALHGLIQEQLEALRERDVAACVEMAFPSGRPLVVVRGVPPPLARREMMLLGQVLREADAARAVKPNRQAVEGVARRAGSRMTRDQLDIFTDPMSRRLVSPEDACEAAIAFFAGLNGIPLAERGRALRVLYTGG